MADLRGKRILVTGGAGFIGSHIVDLLCDEGCTEIVALDNMVRGRPENLADARARGPVRLVHGDIRDSNLMASLVKSADIVFHQAALRITHCAAEPRLAMEVMVQSTFDLLELCVQHKIEKVVAASSASVYGMAEEFPTTERQHPYDNRTLYGAAKAFNEGLLRTFNDMYGLDYVAFRYLTFTGIGWISMADIPKFLFAGWSVWRLVSRRLSSATASRPWISCTSAMLRAPISWAPRRTSAMKCSMLRVAAETSLAQLAQSLASVMGRSELVQSLLPRGPSIRCRAAWRRRRKPSACLAFKPRYRSKRACATWWIGGGPSGICSLFRVNERRLPRDPDRNACP